MRLNLTRPLHSLKMSRAVTKYERDGYTIFRSAISGALLADTKRHIDWLSTKYPHVRPEKLIDPAMVVGDAFWLRLVSDKALLDIAEQFVGPNIALFATGYLSKPARDGQAVLWHQDGSYWPLDPMNVATLWLAVDPSTPVNGCMRVIPGSHRTGLSTIQERKDVPNVLQSGMDSELVDEEKAVDMALNPGDVSVHHPNVIHGSEANNSDQRRCGLIIRYIATSTKILVPEGEAYPTAYLLRGRAVPGVNIYNAWPEYDVSRHMPFQS
jgi:phytanoyl-CoA hydroxylase